MYALLQPVGCILQTLGCRLVMCILAAEISRDVSLTPDLSCSWHAGNMDLMAAWQITEGGQHCVFSISC